MKLETDNLLKISSYAGVIKKSSTWVRTLIKNGKLESVKIDGVEFVKCNK